MEWTPHSKIDNGEEERANANYPEIRFFTVFNSTASVPQQLLTGEWVVCTPETMWNFSAIMYFFGRELYQNLHVPVGLINSSWGGTPLEVWVPEPIIRVDRILSADADKLKPIPWGPHEPGKANNAMIHPLIPFKIKGVLWYQGEANVGFPTHYARALSTLIHTWRAAWGDDFSFYYAQIAPYNGYGKDNVNGAILRDQQRKVLGLTMKTGMVVLSDIGDLDNIHPGNKQEAGKRLANWALNRDYGMSEKVVSGPLYHSYQIEKASVILHFDYAEDGLVAKNGELKEFEILNEEGNWIQAKASIKKNTVIVQQESVKLPKGVRFGYHNNSNPNLFNAAGLPASCFEILF
jgi:sialate O-acetylesterase